MNNVAQLACHLDLERARNTSTTETDIILSLVENHFSLLSLDNIAVFSSDTDKPISLYK